MRRAALMLAVLALLPRLARADDPRAEIRFFAEWGSLQGGGNGTEDTTLPGPGEGGHTQEKPSGVLQAGMRLEQQLAPGHVRGLIGLKYVNGYATFTRAQHGIAFEAGVELYTVLSPSLLVFARAIPAFAYGFPGGALDNVFNSLLVSVHAGVRFASFELYAALLQGAGFEETDGFPNGGGPTHRTSLGLGVSFDGPGFLGR